jgi:hypothetical protein
MRRPDEEALMVIGIVGGLGRSEPILERLAAGAGHALLVHDGDTGQRGVRRLERLVEQAEVVVLVTDVNSHGAVRHARQRLRERGRAPLLVRRFGVAAFAKLLEALGQRAHRGAEVTP